jgi:fructokinase/N-acetylglucosamine kinase
MRIGIDLGGSKIEIIVLGDGGEVLLRERVPTPQGDYAATLAAVGGLVARAEAEVGAGDAAASVGIGIPGAESRSTGLIKNANSTCLIGKPLRRDLEAALGREVRIANDANCFALSEAVDGAGAGASIVFGVILGTGVGGGIVVDGKVLAGANAIAGEWGHNPLTREFNSHPPGPAPRPALHSRPAPAARSMLLETLPRPREGGDVGSPLRGSVVDDAPQCYCGRKDCIELYLSGPGMSADHRRVAGADFPAHEIALRAAAGDAAAEATLQRYEARLARALAGVINILDPDVIVLGGGLSNIDRLYQSVPRLWGQHVFSDRVATQLLKHRHGDSSGVRGAAWLWH